MTDFQWLSDDRRVQQTTFADGTRIIANFGDQPTVISGHDVPAQNVIVLRPDGRVMRYNPLAERP